MVTAKKPAGAGAPAKPAKAPSTNATKTAAKSGASKSAQKAVATKSTAAAAPAKRAPAKVADKASDKVADKLTEKGTSSARSTTAGGKPAKAATDGASGKKMTGSSVYPIKASKDFDAKFLDGQLAALLEEREALTGQARRLEAEANSLIEDVEMGDVQFDDESGEGDTMVVERERDLALSAQARQTVIEIDAAIARLADGTYGYSEKSGLPIPKERLRAIPWATLRVDEKAGGIGRR
jgi:RNA polymerase-binding transcription factor DksA